MATQVDYLILRAIPDPNSDTKGIKKGDGTTVNEIIKKMHDKKGIQVSKSKVYKTLTMFKKEGLIEQGLSYGVKKSYIVTEKGFETLLDVFGANNDKGEQGNE